MESEKINVNCPCCDAKLKIDMKSGEVLWSEDKAKPKASLSDMVKELDNQRQENQSFFNKQNELQKDRARLLDEKFKESKKNADKTVSKPLRDFDLD